MNIMKKVSIMLLVTLMLSTVIAEAKTVSTKTNNSTTIIHVMDDTDPPLGQ